MHWSSSFPFCWSFILCLWILCCSWSAVSFKLIMDASTSSSSEGFIVLPLGRLCLCVPTCSYAPPWNILVYLMIKKTTKSWKMKRRPDEQMQFYIMGWKLVFRLKCYFMKRRKCWVGLRQRCEGGVGGEAVVETRHWVVHFIVKKRININAICYFWITFIIFWLS